MNTYMKKGNKKKERYWFMYCEKNKYNEKTTSAEHGQIKIS